MTEILFLAHRAPFPPDRGDRIRGFHILRYLSQRARVHLIAFADTVEEAALDVEHRALLGECTIVPRAKRRIRAVAEAVMTRRPASVTAFADTRVYAAVRDLLARRPIDAIYAFSGQMGQYLPHDGPRAIMDFVDRDSAKFEAYADAACGPMRWLMRREARLLDADERAVSRRVAASVFVSAEEAALLPGGIAVENGVDTAIFDPDAPIVPVATPKPLIVFTGQMDYRPNIEAVRWFAQDVLPLLPGAHFAIVGRAPVPEVRTLAGPRVTVTGAVRDVRGWLGAADVVVAPLFLARGIQNKVLEAMAMARPVVASTAAAEGIDHAGTVRVAGAGDAAGFAQAVRGLINDRAGATRLGIAARAHVIARYGWEARLRPLDALLGLDISARAAA